MQHFTGAARAGRANHRAMVYILVAVASALIASFGLAGSLAAAPAPTTGWIATWGASPIANAADPARQAPIRFAGQTIRQVVRVSAGGRQVRLRFTNEYGTGPLHVGAARLALTDPANAGAVLPGSDRALTFNGESEVYIPEGAPMLSDPVDLD